MSPISSRNSVPLSASRKLPARSATAPVNAPRTWPNNWLSSSSPGIAAQFTATNGLAARRPWRCSARATTSLPVPVSPVISTVVSASASMPIFFWTSRSADEPPTISSSSADVAAAGASAVGGSSRANREKRSARPTGLAR